LKVGAIFFRVIGGDVFCTGKYLGAVNDQKIGQIQIVGIFGTTKAPTE